MTNTTNNSKMHIVERNFAGKWIHWGDIKHQKFIAYTHRVDDEDDYFSDCVPGQREWRDEHYSGLAKRGLGLKPLFWKKKKVNFSAFPDEVQDRILYFALSTAEDSPALSARFIPVCQDSDWKALHMEICGALWPLYKLDKIGLARMARGDYWHGGQHWRSQHVVLKMDTFLQQTEELAGWPFRYYTEEQLAASPKLDLRLPLANIRDITLAPHSSPDVALGYTAMVLREMPSLRSVTFDVNGVWFLTRRYKLPARPDLVRLLHDLEAFHSAVKEDENGRKAVKIWVRCNHHPVKAQFDWGNTHDDLYARVSNKLELPRPEPPAVKEPNSSSEFDWSTARIVKGSVRIVMGFY